MSGDPLVESAKPAAELSAPGAFSGPSILGGETSTPQPPPVTEIIAPSPTEDLMPPAGDPARPVWKPERSAEPLSSSAGSTTEQAAAMPDVSPFINVEGGHEHGIGDENSLRAKPFNPSEPMVHPAPPLEVRPQPAVIEQPAVPIPATTPTIAPAEQAQAPIAPTSTPFLTPADLRTPYVGTGAEFSGDATTAYIPPAETGTDENNLLARKPAQPPTEPHAPQKNFIRRLLRL